MTLLAVGVSWILAGLALVVAARVHRRSQELLDGPATAPPDPYDDGPIRDAILHLQDLTGAQEERLQELHLAVDEGIKHVDRSERRVRAVVQRARQRLADAGFEDEGINAEASALPLGDAQAGYPEGVQTVRAPVDPARFAAFPGSFAGFGEE